MKSFYKALLVLSLMPLITLGQSNYKAGYIVTLKGDTLRGFIDNKDWDSNPTSINFKNGITDPVPNKYTTTEIGLFNVEGLTFQKYTVSISMDETNISRLSNGKDTSFRTDNVFLQVLQKGTNVALYSYSDNTKTRFYIGEASDYSPHELGYRIYYNYSAVAVRDQKGVTVNENTYMKQLFALANKYQVLNNDLQWDIEHAGYSKDDLMGIVSRINNISKSDYESKYVEHAKSNFYVGGGLNIFSASPKSWASSFGYPSATSVLPEVLIGVNLIPKPKSDKVEFRAELSVADYNYNSVDLIAISIVPQGIYNFYRSENLKLYFGFGFLMTYNIFDNLNVKNGVNNSFMLKAGVKFHNQVEIFANTVTFSESNFINNSSIKAFNEQIGVIYHFN